MRSFFVRAFANMICKKFPALPSVEIFPQKIKSIAARKLNLKKIQYFKGCKIYCRAHGYLCRQLICAPNETIKYCSKLKNKKRAQLKSLLFSNQCRVFLLES